MQQTSQRIFSVLQLMQRAAHDAADGDHARL